jgi:hypothetical protein
MFDYYSARITGRFAQRLYHRFTAVFGCDLKACHLRRFADEFSPRYAAASKSDANAVKFYKVRKAPGFAASQAVVARPITA